MNANEMQHWLDRNRPPRVQITYDVETLGSSVKQSIPFIVGVIGDFAGDGTALLPIAERGFVEIDRDNFPQVMKTLAPALKLDPKPQFQVFRTPDGSTYETDPDPAAEPFAVSLSFAGMEDFAPPAIIRQIPLLQAQMKTRTELRDLLAKLGTTPKMDKDRKEEAAAPALSGARTALTAANTALGGALKAFDDAATAVLTAETDDASKAAVTGAQKLATAAVTGFTADPAATADGSAATLVSTGADAMWPVAEALRDAMKTLRRTAAGYDADSGTAEQKTALQKLADADAVDAFVRQAGAAAMLGRSALALNANTAPALKP
jgi:type VI secretion system protein ImpB